jgi:hypothetical protein
MTNLNEIQNTLNLDDKDIRQLPSMLNILTILTYVACVFGIIMALYSYATICTSVDAINSLDTDSLGNGALGKMMDSAKDSVGKQCEFRLPILIITTVSIILCAFGAMQMRNLKKLGFVVYCVGELLLPIATIFLMGISSFMGIMAISALFIPVIFIILYATQYKNLMH